MGKCSRGIDAVHLVAVGCNPRSYFFQDQDSLCHLAQAVDRSFDHRSAMGGKTYLKPTKNQRS